MRDTVLVNRYISPDSLYPNYMGQETLKGDRNGVLWFVDGYTKNNKIIKFDGQKWENFSLPYDTGEEIPYATCLVTDSAGYVWVGTLMNGLYRFDGATRRRFRVFTGELPTNNIISMAVNPNGTLWIGTDAGLCKYANAQFQIYTESNSKLPYPIIDNIISDAQNRVWLVTHLGTNRVLCTFDGSRWQNFDATNSPLINDIIFELAVANDGKVWILKTGKNKTIVYDPSVVGVEEAKVPQESGGVEIFPNPAESVGSVRIIFPFSERETTLRITDALGREVFIGRVQGGSADISTLGWSAGVYAVSVDSGVRRLGKMMLIK